MIKRLFLFLLFFQLLKLSAQPTVLQSILQLAPDATISERIALRNQIEDKFQQYTALEEKLNFALAYQQFAENKQDSLFLSASYTHLQAIYLQLEKEERQHFFAQKQKAVDSNFGFHLSDLSDDYQFIPNNSAISSCL